MISICRVDSHAKKFSLISNWLIMPASYARFTMEKVLASTVAKAARVELDKAIIVAMLEMASEFHCNKFPLLLKNDTPTCT